MDGISKAVGNLKGDAEVWLLGKVPVRCKMPKSKRGRKGPAKECEKAAPCEGLTCSFLGASSKVATVC